MQLIYEGPDEEKSGNKNMRVLKNVEASSVSVTWLEPHHRSVKPSKEEMLA